MDDGLSQVLKKSGEARLHKLEKFVLFDASTSDYTQEDFLSDATSTENAGRGRRTKENLSDVEV